MHTECKRALEHQHSYIMQWYNGNASLRVRWQLTCELRLYILTAYPCDPNGPFAFVVQISLDAADEINLVAVDAGVLTLWPPGSNTSVFSPIPCVNCILALRV